MKRPLRIGTLLRLPWWTGCPRAVVVGIVARGVPRVVLLGIGRGIRGRVMTLRRDRVERLAKRTGSTALPNLPVPCPCGEQCTGTMCFSAARRLLRRLAR